MKVIYIIDTCSIIDLKDIYPMDIFPSVWKKMGELYINGRLIAPEEVKKEIRDEELKEWIKNKKKMFIPPSPYQVNKVKEILEKYPSLSKHKQPGGPNADPWLIALALELTDKPKILPNKYVIITEESKDKPGKIPAVASSYNIDCINLVELFRKEGWKF
ncbi:MAG: DUF4411 family protein [candidate division WOR-3 bacterium]